VWAELDIADLSPGDQSTIAEEFDLDRFAVEDSVNPRQRPKLERYESHLFMVLHELDEEHEQLEQKQISCFVGDSYVLVIHEGAQRMLDETHRRLNEIKGPIKGPARLIHALFDTVVDDYEAIADRLEIDIEELEERALAASGGMEKGRDTARLPDQRQLYRVKQQVSRLRRFALPLTLVLERVVNREDSRIPDEDTMKMFRDVYDHTLRNGAQVNNVDELADAVINLTRGEQADVLNEINKKLTAWAAIIAAPTLITGFYGMNVLLEPHAGTALGLVVASVLMVGSVVGLYINFRRLGWL
jgi:magnesium transporter